ncbi:glyoxalase [Prauserella marina]|uniref:Catechol 2,3-dioxygenase n=1 Tax=Prauserella marina TaxID=530584 RepID=A0A222VTT0_9PSEU|nr:VOC family protein [Prauserella marina]ASR37242.1 glyoxalase [Prauserella marina]PWV72571.1 catechol 2,3-dioxygenase-like lactoylglutathione lyase family enzyme [Prauserella marina]SDD76891.1 Catechol 2,3-dioxygenase [Prauserella marina]
MPLPQPTRIISYLYPEDLTAAADFYTGVLGMEIVMETPVLCLSSPANPSAQVMLSPPEEPRPSIGADAGTPAAVDAAHAEALKRGLRIVHPPTHESWGVYRFFVEAPCGTIVNVLAHVT